MNPVAREPILTTVVAALIAWAAARYGFKVSPDQAAALAGAVLVVAGPYARQLVRPVAKDEVPLTAEEMTRARALLAVKDSAAKVDQAPVPPKG